MKAEFLKLAGVKSEKAFYKKYPTEAAFFKAHPEAKKMIKKAQNSDMLQNNNLAKDSNNNGVPDYLEINFPYVTGQNQSMNPALGPNQFMAGNNNIGSFYQYKQPAQYPGTMFKGNQIPQNDYVNMSKPPVDMSDPEAPSYQNMNMPVDENIGFMQQVTDAPSFTDDSSNLKKGQEFNMQGFGNVFTGVVGGLQKLKAQKELTRKLKTWANVSDVVKQAHVSNAFAEKPKNQWLRPDDPRFIKSSSEMANIQGRGTDILATQNGSMIGGNPTEIQNTYAPEYTLFDDLGYVPNNKPLKAYAGGGGFGSMWGQANAGLSGSGKTSFMGNVGQGSPLDSFVAGQFGNNAGSQIGGSIGSLFGPVGSLTGTMIGGYLDKEQGKQAFQKGRIGENNSFIRNLDITRGITGGLSSMGVAENGGYMNPEYNPQVITMFGDHTAKDFADYAHKYRAGGHLKEYTAPSERAMEIYENGGQMSSYAMGGQLKTHWGGEARPIAYNPYLSGSGEIVMLDGASHNNNGIGISYGGSEDGYGEMAENGANMEAQIEAEGGEPMIEMASGGSIDSKTGKPTTEAVVFGNIPFTKKLAKATRDKVLIDLANKHDGNTYKRIIEKLAIPQNKANKTKLKASEIANDADNTKWGKLALSTAQAMEKGADSTLKNYADMTMKLANLQNATQDVKKEVSYMKGKNINAEALGKGKIENDYDPITKDAPLENPYARHGAYLRKAQNSKVIKGRGDKWSYIPAGSTGNPIWDDMQRYDQEWTPSVQKALSDKERAKKMLDYINNSTGDENQKVKKSLNKFNTEEEKINFLMTQGTNKEVGPIHHVIDAAIKYTTSGMVTPLKEEEVKQDKEEPKETKVIPYERNKLIDVANILNPLIRRRFPFEFDPRQLAGEYTAIAQNQYEPVPLQEYTTELDPLYRVSYQDVRDQNTADFRDVQRQLGYNPAALAGLLSKKYLANNAVNAEEFRTNQAIEDKIFGGNRAKINQERMANIQLRADQMNKQEAAKSKTKETQQAAISSIADKYLQFDAMKNKYLVQSNLFPQFGYDQGYNIQNQGPWYQPNIPQITGDKGTLKQVPVYGADGKTIEYYKLVPNDSTSETAITKSGGKIAKNNRNSSIVKAIKNL
jgi:hypothetical protein